MKHFWQILCSLVLVWLAVLVCIGAAAEEYDATKYERVGGRSLKELRLALAELPDGTHVNMRGVRMELADRAALVQEFPTLIFHGDVNFANMVVSTEETELDLDALSQKKLSLSKLRNALICLPNVRRVRMYNQSYSVKEVEALMADFPNITFEWTVRFGKYGVRTDVTAFSTLKGRQKPRYTLKDLEPLKYCKDLLALDFGHQSVSDLSFLTQWPHLKVLIVVDSAKHITDLTPLAQLTELEYVELFMQNITDLTPLANHTHLVDLNLCHNHISDLTPLYSCTSLKRLWISYNEELSMEQIEAFQKALPDCQVEYQVYSSTGAGWRKHSHYDTIKTLFETRVYQPFSD